MKPGLLAQSCCTTPAAMCFWAATFVLIYGAALLAKSALPTLQPFGNAAILVALAAACLINFGRNRTLHCGITGPLFVLGAASAALTEAGAQPVHMALMWGLVLVGVGLAFLVEWRTAGHDSTSRASQPPAAHLENVSVIIRKEDPFGRAVVAAIHSGDVGTIKRLLDEIPDWRTPGSATRTFLPPTR